MVNEVNKIIYNTLITQRAVTLPSVGTLSLERHAASMSAKDAVAAPKLSILFSSHAVAVSVVDVIADVGGVDVAVAEDVYLRWLERVRSGSTLTIEGVGLLRNKSFEMDRELANLLNGATPTHVTIRRRCRGRAALWMGLVLSIVALGVSIAALLDNGEECVETAVVEHVEEVVNEDIVVDDVAEDIDEVIVPEVAVEDAEEVAPAVDNWTMRDDIRHWVVAGSYSTMENAERAVAAIEEQYADVHCKIFTLGKMFAVAIYGSNDLEECTKYKQEHRKEFEQCWIFTPKEHR